MGDGGEGFGFEERRFENRELRMVSRGVEWERPEPKDRGSWFALWREERKDLGTVMGVFGDGKVKDSREGEIPARSASSCIAVVKSTFFQRM